MELQNNNIRLFSLNSNPDLAKKISNKLGVEISKCKVNRFADGEVEININDSIRNDVIFVIQSTSAPVNENIMELLIFVDALKRASAKEINVVIPYYGYSRQDRKSKSRQPISAKLVANLLETAGVDRVITLDLHSAQTQGFFDIPTDHMTAIYQIGNYIKDYITDENIVVVSPDHGAVKRARKYAQILNAKMAIIDKRRPRPNEVEITTVIGDVNGAICIMVDDMVDTAGTLCAGAEQLKKLGAKEVYAACTHGLLSGPAIERINDSELKKLLITDTIYHGDKDFGEKIVVISVAEVLAAIIEKVYSGKSISYLFGDS